MAATPTRFGTSFLLSTVVQQIVAYGVAAVAFWPIHQSPYLIIAAGVAIVAGVAIAVAGALRGWNALTLIGVTAAAYLILGVPAAVPDRTIGGVLPTVPGLLDLVSGTALSWKELLTISLPVGSYESLLIPVFLSTLVLQVTTLTIALRTGASELAVIGPVALFLVGTVFGPLTGAGTLPALLALLVLTTVFLVWTRARKRQAAVRRLNEQAGTVAQAGGDRRRIGGRAAAGAAVILIAAVGASLVATQLVPVSGPRDVLRAAVEKPFDPRDHPSPLSAFRTWVGPRGAEVPQLTVTGLEPGERLTVATLDTYDGVVYTVGSAAVSSASGAFTRVPFPFDRSDIDGRRATLDVTVQGYSGLWVPEAGRLRYVDFQGPRAADLQSAFYYNDNSGTAADLVGLDEGDSYRVDTVIPPPVAEDDIVDLRPGGAAVPTIAQSPDELASVLAGWTAGASSDGARLLAAIRGLKQDGYISHGSPGEPFSASGHSVSRIAQLLVADPMLGDAEQYAVTAALMARQLGFPSRVVMGFRIPDEASAGESVEMLGADMTAWIEVNTADQGWVAIDPNPPVREIPEKKPDDATKVARPQSVVPPPAAEDQRSDIQIPPEVEEEQPPTQEPVWLSILLAVLTVLGWVLLVTALALSPFLGVIAAKAARRRRRRLRGPPLQRIAGAWAEFTDAAVDNGVEPAPHATRNEVAKAVGSRESLVLAAAVDRATFAPGQPADEDAAEVWRRVDELCEGMSAGRGRWERIKAMVTLRSFRRHRDVTRSARREGNA